MDIFRLPIGYPRLYALTFALDKTQPVYIASYVEAMTGPSPAQRIDVHYVMVTQPDVQSHVHYCRIPVVRLVYHNGIAFAPDYAEQLAQVEQRRTEVEAWLVGEGYQVRTGMVGLPEGVVLIEGQF